MRVGVPKETTAGERRVALVPDTVGRLARLGLEIFVEAGAGVAAHFPDEAYAAAGAKVVPSAREVCERGELVLKVLRPSADEAKLLPPGAALAAFLQPWQNAPLLKLLAERNITALAMEMVPRVAAAQSMDALSSQATVAGYRAVLLGAGALARMMPMLITAAGTLIPSKVLVLGAGVAGLQAIATARRLGAVVSAFDVRAAAREEIKSLGASFVEVPDPPKDAEAAGGYARELDKTEQQRVLEGIARPLPDMDLVICTAQVRGRPAPRLLTAEMVATMKRGSVIVDLAAETGGNCELTRLGETVEVNGVSLHGPSDLAALVPTHASQMYSRNLQSLVQHVLRNGEMVMDLADPITGPMVVTHQGEIRFGQKPV